jgi:hypothetical protein
MRINTVFTERAILSAHGAVRLDPGALVRRSPSFRWLVAELCFLEQYARSMLLLGAIVNKEEYLVLN